VTFFFTIGVFFKLCTFSETNFEASVKTAQNVEPYNSKVVNC